LLLALDCFLGRGLTQQFEFAGPSACRTLEEGQLRALPGGCSNDSIVILHEAIDYSRFLATLQYQGEKCFTSLSCAETRGQSLNVHSNDAIPTTDKPVARAFTPAASQGHADSTSLFIRNIVSLLMPEFPVLTPILRK